MSASLCTLALVAALGQYPGCNSCSSGGGGYVGGYGGGMAVGGYGGYDSSGYGLSGDQLYPYDQTDPWLHGYFQEIPAYGGYSHFRAYNYKHVFAHAQVGAAWGMPPREPYSHDYFNRLRPQNTVSYRTGPRNSSLNDRSYVPDARGQFDGTPVTVLESRPLGPMLAAPGSVATLPAGREVDPAAFARPARVEDLQEQVRQQNQQLQTLRQALIDEYTKNAGRQP